MAGVGFEEKGRWLTPNQNTALSAVGRRDTVLLRGFNPKTDGPGVIGDVVLEGTTPVSRKVVLLDQRNWQPVRTTVSAADGSYQFAGLRIAPEVVRFAALAIDPSEVYNHVIAANLTPEL